MSDDPTRPGDGSEPDEPDAKKPDQPDTSEPEAQASTGSGERPEAVATDPDEDARSEIEAAKAREAEAARLAQDATFTQRLVAALTGTSVIVTILAILSALVIGAFIIAFSDEGVRGTLGYFFSRPTDALQTGLDSVLAAYSALVEGALGGTSQLSETFVAATPLILTGLAVAVPLRAGLFNIGAEGQFLAGGTVAGLVGFIIPGLPLVIHLPLAIAAGLIAGGLYGWIPGILKAKTGAHEVISTIMLNNIALLVTGYLISTTLFRRPDRSDPISKSVEESARFPRLIWWEPSLRVNTSLVMAFALAVLIFWLMERSTHGFELNAVGLNPSAATSAGMNPARVVVTAFTVAGALSGAAGAATILGLQHRLTIGFSAGLGFDGITVALLGRGRIGGTVAAGILIGILKAGGRNMQAQTGTSLELALVIQALIIVFIAAPGLVRAIFRIKADDLATGQVAKGWGS